MGLIVTIIVGFIVGLIARAIMPGNQSMGLIMTTILGIVGALLALILKALEAIFMHYCVSSGW